MGPSHGDGTSRRPLRKGVEDLHRRAELSRRSNEHCLDALAAADDTTPLHRLLDAVSRPPEYRGRRVRAIRTGDPEDIALLKPVSRGEFATTGFGGRDLRRLLRPTRDDQTEDEVRRLSAKIGRELRLLRAHGVIQKIPKTHRDRLTAAGEGRCARRRDSRSEGASVDQLGVAFRRRTSSQGQPSS